MAPLSLIKTEKVHWLILLCIALRLKGEFRWWGGVGGWWWWWCAKSFSCQTQLSLNCVMLFWSCFGVVVGVLTIDIYNEIDFRLYGGSSDNNAKPG